MKSNDTAIHQAAMLSLGKIHSHADDDDAQFGAYYALKKIDPAAPTNAPGVTAK